MSELTAEHGKKLEPTTKIFETSYMIGLQIVFMYVCKLSIKNVFGYIYHWQIVNMKNIVKYLHTYTNLPIPTYLYILPRKGVICMCTTYNLVESLT